MPIIPWRPFWDIEKWFGEMEPERWLEFPRVPMIRTPRMDIYETDREVVAEVELPGVDPKNIEVEVKENYLRVEAKKEEKKEEKEKGYYRKELSKGYYKRVVPLPFEVIGEKAEASYEEGILKVTIPKAKPIKKEKEKKVKVRVKTKTA
jgi:HSP20 family protein